MQELYHRWLSVVGAITGHGTMMCDSAGLLTWADAAQLCEVLIRQFCFVCEGDVAVLMAPPGREMTLLTLVLWARGATVVPVPTDLTEYEISRLLQAVRPSHLVCSTVSSGWKNGASNGRSLSLPARFSNHEWQTQRIHEDPGNLHAAVCQLTSGSTGAPKPVLLSGRAVLAGIEAQSPFWKRHQGASLVLPVPQHHAMGFAMALESTFHGSGVRVIDKFLPAAFVEAASGSRDTVLATSPHLVNLLSRFGLLEKLAGGTRALVIGSSKTTEGMLRQIRNSLPGTELVVRYGLTEAFGALMEKVWSPDGEEFTDAIGNPISDYKVHPSCVVAGAGSTSRLRIRSRASASAFLDATGAAVPLLEDDGYLDTGDRVRFDGHEFYIEGREQLFIKHRDYRVNPLEVEEVLMLHSSVYDAIVFGHGAAEKEIYALLETGAPVEHTEYVAHCRHFLAPYKVPRRFLHVESFPRTRSGKPDRGACIETALEQLTNPTQSTVNGFTSAGPARAVNSIALSGHAKDSSDSD